MKIVSPSFEILAYTPNMTVTMEKAIRCAYKSEDKIQEGSDVEIIERIKNFKHESTLEHGSLTVKFITDRGVTHELVRHRIASFTQESTRYCNYGKDKFDNQVTFIRPFFWPEESAHTYEQYFMWEQACKFAETQYLALLANGAKAQEARSVLPNSLKTEIVVTANMREWRHIMALRTAKEAHPQIRQIMCPLLVTLRNKWPVLFNDVGNIEHEFPADEILNKELMDVDY